MFDQKCITWPIPQQQEVEEGLQVSLTCTNCFSEDYNSSTLANTTYYNAPGTWMVRARYDF